MDSLNLSYFDLSDNTIGFIIDGLYDEAMIENVQAEVKKKLMIYEKVNFYIEDTENAGISLIKMIRNLPFKIKLAHRFEKIAVVTDRKWVRIFRISENCFFKADLKVFTSKQRIEAIQWVSH